MPRVKRQAVLEDPARPVTPDMSLMKFSKFVQIIIKQSNFFHLLKPIGTGGPNSLEDNKLCNNVKNWFSVSNLNFGRNFETETFI